MNRNLRLKLGPIMNLGERINNNDSPRSIALAKRTFMRSSMENKDFSSLVNDDNKHAKLIKLLEQFEQIRKAFSWNSEQFMIVYGELIDLLQDG